MAKGGGFSAASKGSEGSNGLGASVSVADYGDVEVKAVIEVDVSPLDVDINYDTSSNELGVTGEVGLPGGALSVGGGAIIDLDTGEITGGSASLGFGGAEVEVSVTKCERTLQITYWGVGFAVSENTCGGGNDDDNGGGGGSGNDDTDTPPPNTPRPSLGVPRGYTGMVCPVYEGKTRTVDTWDNGEVDESGWKGFKVDINIEFKLIRVGEVPEGTLEDWTQAYRNSLFWQKFYGNRQALQGNPPTTFKLLSLGYIRTYEWGYTYHPQYHPEPEPKTYRHNIGGVYYESGSPNLDLYSGVEPCYYVENYQPPEKKDTIRRALPPEDMSNNQCCDASVSLLRKIAKVLAVDEILIEDKKKQITTDTIQKFKENYEKLEEQLALINQKPKVVFQNYLQLKVYELAIGGNKKIDEIHDVLRADDLLKKGMKIPNELIVPGGSGFAVVKDYPSILKKFVQIIDLNTIQPFTAVLQDSDPAKEGDQVMTRFFPDATSAIKEVVELLLENKVDSATRLNIQMRQSVLGIETQVALLETLSIAYTILYGLGLPFHQRGSTFVAPFDISPDPKGKESSKKKGKGFNPKNKEEERKRQSAIDALNENREDATEKLLPDFLSTVKQEYLHTYFNDKNESLWYYIMSVLMRI